MTGDDDRWNPSAETHDQWRWRRILEGQRARRGTMRRIDYYASDAAAAVVHSLQRAGVGGGRQFNP